jgi:Leucine-rich repeat (LRR) protein
MRYLLVLPLPVAFASIQPSDIISLCGGTSESHSNSLSAPHVNAASATQVPLDLIIYAMSFVDRVDGLSLICSLVQMEENKALPRVSKMNLNKEETLRYLANMSVYDLINRFVVNPETDVELLSYFHFSSTIFLGDSQSVSVLTPAFARLPHLAHLDLQNTPVSDISNLRFNTDLVYLDLSDTRITDISVV